MIEVTLCIDGVPGLSTRDSLIKTNMVALPHVGDTVSVPDHLTPAVNPWVPWWTVTQIVHSVGLYPTVSVGISPEARK